MIYNDNKERKRIYGQPKDAIEIIKYLYPSYEVIQDNLDDELKQSIPDFLIKTPNGDFRLEWQEFKVVNGCIAIKYSKAKYMKQNNSAIINFNRITGKLYYITSDMIQGLISVDLYDHIDYFRYWNEHKYGFMVPIQNCIEYTIPEELYVKKGNINIIPCPSQKGIFGNLFN